MRTELEQILINFIYLLADECDRLDDGWVIRDKIMDFMKDNEL